MKKIPTIKAGDPQPTPCPKCNDFHGYQITENIRGQYTTQYFADGSHEGGFYGDSITTVRSFNRAECQNCGKKLPFKIDITDP